MEDQDLNSFYFKTTIGGVEHDYRITMNETTYEVEHDGILVAELQHTAEGWEQITGVQLLPEFIQELGDKIESTFE
jgi:hypothetical protein